MENPGIANPGEIARDNLNKPSLINNKQISLKLAAEMAASKTLLLVLLSLQIIFAQKSNLSVDVNECGFYKNVVGKIYNGNETRRYEHPWLVRIHFF